jgi:hypothetical protein
MGNYQTRFAACHVVNPMVKFLPCRYLGAPEVEDTFCEECLVPCSSATATVGPHVRHRVSPLVAGLDGRIQGLFASEVSEYDRALRGCAACVNEVIRESSRPVDAAMASIAQIDADIARLQDARQAAVEAEIQARRRRQRAVGQQCEKLVHLFRLGRHRVDHGLQHALEPVLVDDARYDAILDSLDNMAASLEKEMRRTAEETVVGIAAVCADDSEAAAEFSESTIASPLARWIDVLLDTANRCDPPAGPIPQTITEARGKAVAPARRREPAELVRAPSKASTAAEDDDANWCFHGRAARHGAVEAAAVFPTGRSIKQREKPFPVSSLPSRVEAQRSWLRNQLVAACAEQLPAHSGLLHERTATSGSDDTSPRPAAGADATVDSDRWKARRVVPSALLPECD